jgi:hypothetical protein
MRVLVMPADLGGCGHYRMMFPAEHLASTGHEVIISPPLIGNQNNGFSARMIGDKMLDVTLPVPDVDVVVLQRLAHVMHQQTVPLLRSKGIAVVVDMDDNLSCIHPKNVAFQQYHPMSQTQFSYKAAAQICKDATLVTVTTPALLNTYASHGRGMVLDNYVPERYLDIDPIRTDPEPVLGWPGNTISHPADLLACGRSMEALMHEGFRFKVVGQPNGVRQQLRLTREPETTGNVGMANWPSAIANNIDVGIAPLEVSEFNRGKSRLKPLELNALGIPYVASPRDAYRQYHKDSGGGLLAESSKEWYSSAKRLLTDHSLRKELGEKGREHAETQTVELNSWRWMEAWTKAVEIQRSGK